jgi:hypothetical protein
VNDRDLSELEQRLRRTMRPVEPPAGFSANVMAALKRTRERTRALPAARRPSNHSAARLPWLRRRPVWFPAAAALATVLIGAGLWHHQHAQELRAREARDQVIEALRISSRTLNEALHATLDPSRSG